MKLKCVIIDDEIEAIEEITEYIAKTPELELTESFTSPLLALNYIRNNSPFDIIFMDVDMPELTGIELSKLIRKYTDKLILTTSHSKYALDAFDVEADQFLLKPFNLKKFVSAIEKVLKKDITDRREQDAQQDYIFVKSKEENLKLVKLKINDIVAIESLLNYVRIYMPKTNIVTHMSLKEAKDLFLRYNSFIQLHRSFIISSDHIEGIEGNNLTMSNGKKITIGDSYRTVLNDFLHRKTLRPTSK
ncbi:LytTR family DNA-binding domain-containing protein [uncultured Pedobacter sp.]|uniref:LytR/AlgR family response regulator transcription factor n=1 Tax=uncultured Pedobacter sp. TaxID=246139 RepID=UPI0025D9C922|nr:LytTR family DNA-binding domain-containing protein [uncultured Pedobacter sp.]